METDTKWSIAVSNIINKLRKYLFVIVCEQLHTDQFKYSRSSRKRPPREFEQVVVTRAGRLQEYALVSDPMVKH